MSQKTNSFPPLCQTHHGMLCLSWKINLLVKKKIFTLNSNRHTKRSRKASVCPEGHGLGSTPWPEHPSPKLYLFLMLISWKIKSSQGESCKDSREVHAGVCSLTDLTMKLNILVTQTINLQNRRNSKCQHSNQIQSQGFWFCCQQSPESVYRCQYPPQPHSRFQRATGHFPQRCHQPLCGFKRATGHLPQR